MAESVFTIVLSSDDESESGDSAAWQAKAEQAKAEQAKADHEAKWEKTRLEALREFDVQWEIIRERERRRGRGVAICGVAIFNYELNHESK